MSRPLSMAGGSNATRITRESSGGSGQSALSKATLAHDRFLVLLCPAHLTLRCILDNSLDSQKLTESGTGYLSDLAEGQQPPVEARHG